MNKLKLRSRWRKVITGDESKRIRDALFETQEKDEYIKLFDKISFTLGVLNIVACQYFLFNVPGWFWIWWSIVTVLLLFARFYHFSSLNYEYFLLDFCYFVTCCVFLNLYIFPHSIWFTNVCYIYTLGPLLFAIPLWRNSLVFHDYDKITSVYIHILPGMMCHIRRFYGLYKCNWELIQLERYFSITIPIVNSGTCSLIKPTISMRSSLYGNEYLYAIIGYLVWQTLYFYKTEILDKSKLDQQPAKLTSLRYMAKDLKNPFVSKVLKILRKLKIYDINEYPDSSNIKTKLIFVFSQFMYTLCTFLPTYFVSKNSFLSLSLIGIIFTVSVFNGAEFYIEIFSKRYQGQFKGKAIQTQELHNNSSNKVQQGVVQHSPSHRMSIGGLSTRSENDIIVNNSDDEDGDFIDLSSSKDFVDIDN